jgi:hypothetical protein
LLNTRAPQIRLAPQAEQMRVCATEGWHSQSGGTLAGDVGLPMACRPAPAPPHLPPLAELPGLLRRPQGRPPLAEAHRQLPAGQPGPHRDLGVPRARVCVCRGGGGRCAVVFGGRSPRSVVGCVAALLPLLPLLASMHHPAARPILGPAPPPPPHPPHPPTGLHNPPGHVWSAAGVPGQRSIQGGPHLCL